MPVIFSAKALNDLQAIRNYIGEQSPAASSRIAVALMAASDSLEHLPQRGRPGLRAGTREITIIWPYIITYKVDGANVGIVEITHGARDR